MAAAVNTLHRRGLAWRWIIGLFYLFAVSACSQSTKSTLPTSMTTDQALLLTKAWCREARESFDDKLMVKPNGDFDGSFGAADINYSAQRKTVQVYGLVMVDASGLVEFPDLFADFERAGKRENYTLGEGYFFILMQPVGQEKPQLTLRKDFTDGSISPEQFVREVDWLMQWSTHWRQQRSYDVSTKPEDELIRQGAAINEWARKKHPRPW